jgi:hypothetical protein
MEKQEEKKPVRRRRRWGRRCFVGVVLGAVFLLWLDGPGLRWLGPRVAAWYFGGKGLRASVEVGGRFSRGMVLKDLEIAGGAGLESLRVGEIRPRYRPWRLLQGRLEGLEARDVDLRIRSGAVRSKEGVGKIDLASLPGNLRVMRERLLPMEIGVRNISVRWTEGEGLLCEAGSGAILHQAGSDVWELSLGAVRDGRGRVWPAQRTPLRWGAEAIEVEALDPLPGVGLRGLLVSLPVGGAASLRSSLLAAGGVFLVESGYDFSSLRVSLQEGSPRIGDLLSLFGLRDEARGSLVSFSLDADRLGSGVEGVLAEARIAVEGFARGGWEAESLSADIGWSAGRFTLASAGRAYGTSFSLRGGMDAAIRNGRLEPGDWQGEYQVEDPAALHRAIAPRMSWMDGTRSFPDSRLNGEFRGGFADAALRRVEIDGRFQVAEGAEAKPALLRVVWSPGDDWAFDFACEGVELAGGVRARSGAYRGKVSFREWRSEGTAPWFAPFRISVPRGLLVSGQWSGDGEPALSRHRGAFDAKRLLWNRDKAAPVLIVGNGVYDWPSGFSARGLRAEAGGQRITTDVALDGGILRLAKLRWEEGGRALASGSAELPFPADPSRWREELAEADRPVRVDLVSQRLSFGRLAEWFPAFADYDPKGELRVEAAVGGTMRAPVVDCRVEATACRPIKPVGSPAGDLLLRLRGEKGILSVQGDLRTPGYPVAVLSGSMPFRPDRWIGNPAAWMREPVQGRVEIPRFDIGRFQSMIPGASGLKGRLSGGLRVSGWLGAPVVDGRLELSGGGISFPRSGVPAIGDVGGVVEFTRERVQLRGLRAASAGGVLEASGSLDLREGAVRNIDLRIKGRHLPLLRDESWIVRAHADLRVNGPWDRALVGGEVAVVDSLFHRDIELLPIGVPLPAPTAAALPRLDASPRTLLSLPAPFATWPLSVRVRSANPFLVRGNFATGRAVADMRIGGVLARPEPSGEISVSDFEAALPFSKLQVKRGRLLFDPAHGFDPVLEIRGSSEPRPYRVSMNVYGRASDPQLVLSSSPPLPENEIMILLASGATTTGLEDPQAASSRALQLLAEELRRGRFGATRSLRPLLGLADRVDFAVAEPDPYTSESYSTATLEITDRWYLSAGMGAEGETRAFAVWRIQFR